MSAAVALSGNKEIGDLLLKVQDELKDLRTKIANHNGGELDLKALQIAIRKTEGELKLKTDSILNDLNSQVAIIATPENNKKEIQGSSIENLWSITEKKSSSHSESNQCEQYVPQLALRSATVKNQELVPVYNNEVIEINPISGKVTGFGPSPGQQAKIERETRALFNPENQRNRTALEDNYQISLPLIEKRSAYKMQTHLITGNTIDHLSTLPLVYRRNPSLMPPPIDQSEAKHGLYSLLERGLIPPYAKISFDPEPIVSKVINLAGKDTQEAFKRVEYTPQTLTENVYKLDRNYEFEVKNRANQKISSKKNTPETDKQNFLKKKTQSTSTIATKALVKPASLPANGGVNLNPLPPPVTPSNALQMQLYDISKSTHRFIIQNGRVRTDMHDYISFKQSYCLRWGSIVTIIKCLEDLCVEYSIAMGFIDGLKVSDLALCLDMDLKPNQEELVDTFLNKEEIEKLIRMPGRRFKKVGGQHLAAITIQCAWKCYRDRQAYLKFRKRRWAAGVIALTWLTYFKINKAREKLKMNREEQLGRFRIRQKEFQKNWPRIKKSKKIVIHMPSLGYAETIRERMNDLPVRQMQQMARVCDIVDENTDIIYIAALPITEETLQYYSKLFGLRAAVITGDVANQNDVSSRYKIVIPEALDSFPTHNMSVATLLKYSPKALMRISNLIKGREAYIVPGIMSHDDVHIADVLNLPVLASEPELNNLYTTKSGSKRIFQAAKVTMPIGEFDIYNREQLFETLAQAIVDNLAVKRWIFKLDDEFDGRGIVYCDVASNLTCYNLALREMTKYGDKWSKRWAHEAIFVKILEELPGILEQHAIPVNRQLFPDWQTFLIVFLAQGGVFEAHPPSDSVTALTVSILIEPDMSAHILSSGDHVHAESEYSCWGISFPQTSVDPLVLNDECSKVIQACKERKIFGYIDIDFVTFIDAKTDKQVLWATDLNISYSDHVAMASMLLYMTNGRFDWSHSFEVDSQVEKVRKVKGQKVTEVVEEKQLRYAVMSARLYHTNLAVIHYSVFFQTCRALGIGYDIREKQGTVFSLVDSLNHKHMGMIAVKDNLQTAMKDFARNLTSLHKEISSANMQGITNFMVAAEDINSVLKATDDDESEISQAAV